MSQEYSKDNQAAEGATLRTRISCPGCGRNDYVRWPDAQDTFPWKCFNCGKAFDLRRKASH